VKPTESALVKAQAHASDTQLLTIRTATLADTSLIRRLILELAHYEKEPDQVCTTEADIARDGFGANPQFRVLIAEWRGQPAGLRSSSATTRHRNWPPSNSAKPGEGEHTSRFASHK
jgi:hypothetical protein